MSEQNSTGGDLYSRPTEIDDGAYLRIRQIRPVERAAAPIVDHNIQLTETAPENIGFQGLFHVLVPKGQNSRLYRTGLIA